MSSEEISISVRSLTKTYRLFGRPGDRLKQFVTFGTRRYHSEFTALRGISFDVRRGEALGVAGRNGSGKSTLLQLICGILRPTSGSVRIAGRVSALLELGSGFNPDFTGRENVYFQGALLGLSKRDIDICMGEILDFADIGDFIDQPMHSFSSGMFARLAFAVAANVRPDVLIVDEALAVGDEQFQRRCFEHIRNLQSGGTSIVFVSHDINTMIEICDRVLLLENSEMVALGPPIDTLEHYRRLLFSSEAHLKDLRDSIIASRQRPVKRVKFQENGARIANPRLTTSDGNPADVLRRGRAYVFSCDVTFFAPATSARGTMVFKATNGFELGGLFSHPVGEDITQSEVGIKRTFSYEFRCVLLPGTYFINCGVFAGAKVLHRIVDACTLRVAGEGGSVAHGLVDFSL